MELEAAAALAAIIKISSRAISSAINEPILRFALFVMLK